MSPNRNLFEKWPIITGKYSQKVKNGNIITNKNPRVNFTWAWSRLFQNPVRWVSFLWVTFGVPLEVIWIAKKISLENQLTLNKAPKLGNKKMGYFPQEILLEHRVNLGIKRRKILFPLWHVHAKKLWVNRACKSKRFGSP